MEMRQVVFHEPGSNWQHGVEFREQPGVMDHVQYYAGLHAQGKLFRGGPFTDADSGGMMVATEDVTRNELEAFAAEDPAILSGLLTYTVKTWYIPMAENQ